MKPELFVRGDPADLNPLVAQLSHLPFPEVAQALRSEANRITCAWDTAVRHAMPQMQRLTIEEMRDSTPEILLAIADALASDDPQLIRDLICFAPRQGLSRLRLNFDVVEVMQEDRLLRAIIVLHVEDCLDRRMSVAESAALHANIDLMLQRSVIALVDEQKSTLRVAAENELKFLSFLAHDMNNNLNNVNLQLSVLAIDLEELSGSATALESLRLAQKSIEETTAGMREMLEHERLQKSKTEPAKASVDLHKLAESVAWQYLTAASQKRIEVIVEVLPDTCIVSNGELITVVLQNLVGNSIKYSSSGTIRIGSNVVNNFDTSAGASRRSIWVSDNGAGIAPEKLREIFTAFRRGEIHGQWGVGLGLAIASQGAKLLNAELSVESTVGVGSTFRMSFQS